MKTNKVKYNKRTQTLRTYSKYQMSKKVILKIRKGYQVQIVEWDIKGLLNHQQALIVVPNILAVLCHISETHFTNHSYIIFEA